VELKDAKQKLSYAIGMDIGSNLKRQEIDVDAKTLGAGIADALGGKPQLSDSEAKQVIMELQTQMRAKMQAKQAEMEAKQQEAAPKNLKAGEEFLAANAKKQGVKTTASGLQYKVLKSGDGKGKTPKSTDTVKVHYHGTLIDGTVFDSSVDRGQPATFGVDQVIPGWTEVLQLMKEGDKWQVYIPSKLAYGERGAGAQIGPNSTLVFDVELLSVEKPN
jgi:FKBP-type peptidyl-prolyl cis-trans isomerase FklB